MATTPDPMESVQQIADMPMNAVGAVGDTAQNLVMDKPMEAMNQLASGDVLGAATTALLKAPMDLLKAPLDIMGQTIGGASSSASDAKGGASDMADSMTSGMQNMMEAPLDAVKSVVEAPLDMLKSGMQMLAKPFEMIMQGPQQLMSMLPTPKPGGGGGDPAEMLDGITSKFSSIGNDLMGSVNDAGNSLMDGDPLAALGNVADGLVSTATNIAKLPLDIAKGGMDAITSVIPGLGGGPKPGGGGGKSPLDMLKP